MAAQPKPIIKAGDLIYLSCGEYSDYSVCGIFIAAKTFNFAATKQDYRYAKRGEYASAYDFPAWLVQQGFIVEIDVDEWHYDSY